MAYQVFSDPDIPNETAEAMSRLPGYIGMPVPDAVLLLDVGADTAEARLAARGRRDYFEMMGRDYFERVRAGYLRQMESADGGRWMLIDASGEPEDVFKRIAEAALELF
jgi:thymidylate kinase